MAIKWTKTTNGFRSVCGRFEITRYIRRGGIEWGVTDNVCPMEKGVSGCLRTLREAKDVAEWRSVNRNPGKPLIKVL